jgi:dipeptidyl aminopeptidase/acylaminoacyl peptidase
MLPYAKAYNFHLLLPEFRGPNLVENPRRTEALGSPLAVQDIFDAAEYVKKNYKVDEKRVYLVGCSGGGHMSLMCAAKHPDYFTSVASFVPITDVRRWERENPHYAKTINACCRDEADMISRSPITYAESLAKANLKIFHGKYDTSVTYKQSVDLFLEIMKIDPASRVFLDIFDGGHEIDMQVAAYWLISQYNTAQKTLVTG